MANVRLITPNLADLATLTASPIAVATLSVTNLQDPLRGKVWRSTSLATQTILGEIDSGTALSAFALVRHNLSAAATLRVRVYAGAAQTGTVLYDSGVVTIGTGLGWGDFDWGDEDWGGGSIFTSWGYAWNALYWAPVLNALSFSILITDVGNVDGYMQASRLFMGNYFSPTYDVNQGDLSIEWGESSAQQRTAGGSLRTDNVDPFRKIGMKLRHITDAEHGQLLEINRVTGIREDVFLDVYPDDGGAKQRNYSGQFKLVRPVRFVPTHWENDYQAYEADFAFEEA